MEIVTSLPTGGAGARGGTKKHVEEWSRLDQLTGMLEHARVEADHWSSNTSNSRHHFGKIVDSRARNLADGSVQQQQQTKQLEVFQAHIPGRSVQVIRSHTSTSSSWHNSKQILRGKSHLDWPPSLNGSILPVHQRLNNMEAQLDDFKLHDNLVNLNIEKSKASVARLLPSRRPPTRSKLVNRTRSPEENEDDLHPKSCIENGLDSIRPVEGMATVECVDDKTPPTFCIPTPTPSVPATMTSSEQTDKQPSATNSPRTRVHETLTKKKSISDENLAAVDDQNANSDLWKRNSKSRWSFQYTRSKFKDDVTGADAPTAARLDAKSELENVLQRVLRRKGENLAENVPANRKPVDDHLIMRPKIIEPAVYPKRKSFVTEKSLLETKLRLRHLNGFDGIAGAPGEIHNSCHNDTSTSCSAIETDDGICTDSRGESDKDENECGANADSTNSFANCGISSSAIDTSTHKTDEWYDRRKSYGFEPVGNFSLKKSIFADPVKPVPKTNLSTDSGICRSSELELASTSMVRRLTAEVSNQPDMGDSRTGKVETPELVSKSADVFELLRKFEKRAADEAAASTKTGSCDTWKVASDGSESAPDIWRRPRTPKDDDSAASTKSTDNSWIRRSAKSQPQLSDEETIVLSKTNAGSWSATMSKSQDGERPAAAGTVATAGATGATGAAPAMSKGRVLEALQSLRQNSHGNAFEPHSQLFRRSNDSQDMEDVAFKRHSIACDDAKYVRSNLADDAPTAPHFHDKLSSLTLSEQPNTTVVNVSGGEVVPLAAGEISVAADVKKPKKVEFSKTEVHFAAAEPGKIKIVETDEKPPPANLYRRKKRSVSASPKMLGVKSGYTKFGDHEEHKLVDEHEAKTRPGRRNSFAAPNSGGASHTWPADNSTAASSAASSNVSPRRKYDFRNNEFGSSTCDNGLAVTISSMRPTIDDSRPASWSISECNDSNAASPAGYSTKINFGREGVTVIADTKSRKQSGENVAPKSADASRDDENFREKLIVRIGECARGSSGAATKNTKAASSSYSNYKSILQGNRFINGFRSSVFGYNKLDDRLKSTSLIIDTIRNGTIDKSAINGAMNKKPIAAVEKQKQEPLEQPSTYIMEMNELQQRYNRARQNRSLDRMPAKVEAPSASALSTAAICTATTTTSRTRYRGLYNTVPVSKNTHLRSRLTDTDLLLDNALNVFDRLYKASRGDCNKQENEKHNTNSSKSFIESAKVKEQSKRVWLQHRERRSSQTSSSPLSVVHPLIGFHHDGNISDDSLKADEEVRSYMSTAALDEYENELAGSWSRKKYLWMVKSHKTIKEDEILEKSLFKPLRIAEEKVKTVTSHTNVDIKRPKITSVAVNVLPDIRPADSCTSAKKFTTVLLNANESRRKSDSPVMPLISGAHDSNYSLQLQDLAYVNDKPTPAHPEEHIIPLSLADDHRCKRTYVGHKDDHGTPRSRDPATHKSTPGVRTRGDIGKPITIIHHGIRLPDRVPADSRRLGHPSSSSSPKKEMVGSKPRSRKSVPLAKEPRDVGSHTVGFGGGSLRRKAATTAPSIASGKERLFDSGRDSWLNLPKERKSATGSSGTAERYREYSKNIGSPRKLKLVDAVSSDVDHRQATNSHHHLSSKIPSSNSSRQSKTAPGFVDVVAGSEADATDADADADTGAGIMSTTTYTDASSEEDSNSRRTAYRKQFSSKPLTTISEKSRLRLVDRQDRTDGAGSSTVYAKIRPMQHNSTTASHATMSKPSVTRTASNSSLESRSNSYEFKYPALKTEERSKRRAARMLQRATSREALLKGGGHVSSSEDITSDNEKLNTRISSKLKPNRKLKSSRISSRSDTTNHDSRVRAVSSAPRSKPNRLIQQRSATMEINIFNIKNKPNERKEYIYGSAKSQSSRGKIEADATSHQKSNNHSGYSATRHKSKKDESVPLRVTRTK